jgi:hypothetical protein
VYQAINSRKVDTFVEIRNRVRMLFPHVQDLLVPTVANNPPRRHRPTQLAGRSRVCPESDHQAGHLNDAT